jgi:hypothetical protein
MSYKQRPDSGQDRAPSGVVESLQRLADRVRTHVATWPAQYVEMHVDARGD